MANDSTSNPFTLASSDVLSDHEAALRAAHVQALAELNQIRGQASVNDNIIDDNAHYSIHEAAGVGKYVIPRRTGWKALIDIIHDPVPNIDFSANVYPAFDGILGERFQSPHLLDPLDEKYESRKFFSRYPGRKPYEDLRDNIAAVRNFLMQSYYAETPEGMTPEKARASLAEIATFVGDGLYNNWLFLGVIPNHKLTEPFIDLTRAQAPHGEGAQYIYQKILEHQRHSNWMRPFTAVAALFGGKPATDWHLPPAYETHFTDRVPKDIVGATISSGPVVSEASLAALASIEARLASIKDARALTHVATDLDALGNHLLYTAQNMQGVAHISEPIRRDAVDIARDILRKLKLSVGNLNVMDGLNMKPSDDVATLGAVKGVAMVYERLLAWARGNNDSSIFQHPSIIAATQAIGQLGYISKLEAKRIAHLVGNEVIANTIGEQIKRLPSAYTTLGDGKLGTMLDTVEQGINTVINRIQQVGVNGAKVGFSVDSSMGSSIGSPPTAGSANQVGAEDAARRNAQAAIGDQLAAQAQANRIHAQMAAQARTQQQPSQQQQAQAAPRGASTVGRQSLQAARTAATRPSTTSNNAAQQQQAARSANAEAAARAAREREEQLAREQQQLATQRAQSDAAKKAAATAAKIHPDMLKGFKAATSMNGVTGQAIMGGRPIDPKSVAAMKQPQKPIATPPAPLKPATQASTISATGDAAKDLYTPPQPNMPPAPGRGR
jgi:hypothetical protein